VIVDAVGGPAVVIVVCEKAKGYSAENSGYIRNRLPPYVENFFIICRNGGMAGENGGEIGGARQFKPRVFLTSWE
jgi:hypothetical protein